MFCLTVIVNGVEREIHGRSCAHINIRERVYERLYQNIYLLFSFINTWHAQFKFCFHFCGCAMRFYGSSAYRPLMSWSVFQSLAHTHTLTQFPFSFKIDRFCSSQKHVLPFSQLVETHVFGDIIWIPISRTKVSETHTQSTDRSFILISILRTSSLIKRIWNPIYMKSILCSIPIQVQTYLTQLKKSLLPYFVKANDHTESLRWFKNASDLSNSPNRCKGVELYLGIGWIPRDFTSQFDKPQWFHQFIPFIQISSVYK